MSGTGPREAILYVSPLRSPPPQQLPLTRSSSPTRMNLTLTKGRLKGAQTGHSLLAKKRDALTTRFRTILRKVDEAKRAMGRVLQLASFSLAEVTYTAGDIGYQVQESVRKASYTVAAKQENVSGVVLPAFEGVRSGAASGESPLAVSAFVTSTDQWF